ncbi:MAG: hypothetical protein E4H01_15980 [Lysobacterales bacterium]|nr:MAG: hypothetical protein E4H01_15980 [Xanthomonadales bacterium]
MNKMDFTGTIVSVKARIRLVRSFDQVPTHQYQGYTLILNGEVDGISRTGFKVAVGPKAHEQHQFRIGDTIRGTAIAVPDSETEWTEFYKVSGLQLIDRTQPDEPPNPTGGIAPPLERYREHGHLRLKREICTTQCFQCPFGLTMPTQIILDQWNPSNVKWRFETHCYGPRDCPRYKAGPAYRVPGRKPGMVYVDNDVERAARED